MITLYKKGDESVVRGVKCNLIRCTVDERELYLSQGYSADLKSLYVEQKPATKTSNKNQKRKGK